MAVAAVVFNGTRVDSLDTNTNTGHWVGSGGAPAAEAPLAYQNAVAVNKKVIAATLQGIDFDPGASPLDMTATANKLWFVKVYVSDSFDVDATFGVAAGIGSGNAAYYKYNLSGSGAKLPVYDKYPSQGGYILTAIDPNIAAWRDSTTGSPVLTAVDWFGVQCAMINGNAKSENLAFDAIDVGTGLTITAGDGASTEGNFTDFVAADQDAPTIRWGCVSGSGDAVKAWCLLAIGTSAVTEFLDSTSIVTFKDGYHSAGLVGVLVDIQNASSIINIGALLVGEGTVQVAVADDTRPDFVVSGTAGTFDCSATMRNFRNIEFTSVCDVINANLECQLLTQASSNISDSIIRTNAISAIACLQDPTFGSTTDLHDVEFIQVGVGHALEISAIGTYTLTNIDFTGYGADATNDAAIFVNTTAAVTLNIIGGTTPTFRTIGTSNVTIVANPVTLKIICKDEAGVLITGLDVNVLVEAAAGGPETVGTDIIKGFTDVNGEIEDSRTYASNQPIVGWARKSTSTPFKKQSDISGTIDKDAGLTITLLMQPDE